MDLKGEEACDRGLNGWKKKMNMKGNGEGLRKERKENRSWRQSEGGKTESGKEKKPEWVCDELSLFEVKILLIPSGYHTASSSSATCE